MRRIILFIGCTLILAGIAQAQVPRINSFTPRRGSPGTSVFITGQNLGGVTTVTIGLGSAQILQRSSSQLTVLVPPDATIGSIVAYSNVGQDVTFENFQVSPRVGSFERTLPQPQTPNDRFRGVPGNTVSILGANFSDPSDPNFRVGVFFAHVPAHVQTASDGQILVTIPQGAVTGPLTVTNNVGAWTTQDDFYLQPLVSAFEPHKAVVGQTIELKGTSLRGTSSVLFGTTPATPDVVTSTNVIVRVPQITGDVKLTLTSPGGSYITSSNLVLLPKIDSFTPTGGEVSTWVTLTGSGLAAVTDAYFGGVRASGMSNISSGVLSARVPAGALTGPLRVRNAAGTNETQATFFVAPSVTQFAPTLGQTGTVVTVTGLNFTGTTRVDVGETSGQFTILSNTQLTVVVPSEAQTGRIRIVGPGGTVQSLGSFQVIGQEPLISGFSPQSGPVGTDVVITGQNFTDATSVMFGELEATQFTVTSDTSLTAKVPAGASSGPITVNSLAGSVTSASSFFVGSTADVYVQMSALPGEALVGEVVEVSVSIRNNGPLPAAGVALAMSIPSGTFVEDLTVSQGAGDAVGLGVTFNIGTIQPDGAVVAKVFLRLNREGNFQSTAQATAGTPDTVAENDQATVQFQGTAPVIRIVRMADGRLVLRWPMQPESIVVESSNVFPADPWVEVPGPYSVSGEMREHEITAEGLLKIYRLRW